MTSSYIFRLLEVNVKLAGTMPGTQINMTHRSRLTKTFTGHHSAVGSKATADPGVLSSILAWSHTHRD